MAYGANLQNRYRRGAEYVDRILRGDKPANLPVEQADKFTFVLNLKTAKAPSSILPKQKVRDHSLLTSPADAVGLMQVTPEAGRDTAKRFGVTYDWKRLVSDPDYKTQMGAVEIGALFREYNGSYIMTFAGYNAGRGRVRQRVAQHGDPRDPKIDAVDWVERIPLVETRNYVQRMMENLQVYAARLGTSVATVATVDPNLHRVTTIESRAKLTFADAIPKISVLPRRLQDDDE